MADRDLNDARLDATRTTTTGAAGTTGADTDLRRLSELDDYEVADGHPDIRGWSVRTPDGQVLGKVDDLVVSVREMRVRYLDVDVDRSVRSGVADAATPKGAERGHALVPIGTAQLDDAGDNVVVRSLSGADLASYPLYARETGITRDYEQSLHGRFSGASGAAAATGATAGATGAAAPSSDFYGSEHYDDAGFFDRNGDRTNAGSLDQASATAGGSDSPRAIPTTRENAGGQGGTERNSVVVRRNASTSGTLGSSMGAGPIDRTSKGGVGGRIANKVDDLKDRVDGNPASRPGPDSTDSRI